MTPSRAPRRRPDTIGELALLYQLATAVFVGGSLVDRGATKSGSAQIFGKPILFGPTWQNFKEIADTFLSNDAAVQVESERGSKPAIVMMLADPVRGEAGRGGRALFEAKRGAKDKTRAVIADLLCRRRVSGVWFVFRLVH